MMQLGGIFGIIATVSAVFSHPLVPSVIPPPVPQLPKIILHGPTARKEIALTFDADMTPGMARQYEKHIVTSWYNRDVITILKETNTKATLFLTGLWAELYPQDAKKLAENPLFEIGNHSYSHPSLGGKCFGLLQIPITAYGHEVKKSEEVLEQITGIKPKYFRFPGGCENEFSLSAVRKEGLIPIGWDIVSNDSFNMNTKSIVDTVLGKAHNGAIIVMHMHGGPNAPKTAEALRAIIPALEKKGYTFVTISELLPKLAMQYTQR